MNTLAESTRTHHTTTTAGAATRAASPRSLRSNARRLAGWLTADPMSATFSASRERDERLLQRLGR